MSQADPARGVPAVAVKILAVAMPATVGLWFGLVLLLPTPEGMADTGRRLTTALGWICVSALFSLAAGIEAVAHERLRSTAFDPLAGRDSRRLQINQRYVQNTLEQFCLFAPGLAGLAYYCGSDAAMRAVPATALTWIAARFAFWIGYHRGSAYRAAGVPGLIIPLLLLLYVAARAGHDLAGLPGAISPVALYVGVEIALLRATRPPADRTAGDDAERRPSR